MPETKSEIKAEAVAVTNYEIPDEEITRFKRHGIAHAIPTVSVRRDNFCHFVDISPIILPTLKFPRHAWIPTGFYDDYTPVIVVANDEGYITGYPRGRRAGKAVHFEDENEDGEGLIGLTIKPLTETRYCGIARPVDPEVRVKHFGREGIVIAPLYSSQTTEQPA